MKFTLVLLVLMAFCLMGMEANKSKESKKSKESEKSKETKESKESKAPEVIIQIFIFNVIKTRKNCP